MSLSPTRSYSEHLIESQIRQRINYFSPSKNDLDFYQRKVGRLESDLTQLQQQLSVARLRLRTAEDFEIKYELLMKQNSNLIHQNGKLAKELAKRKAQYEQVNGDVHSHELQKAQLERTVLRRDEEIAQLRKKINEYERDIENLKQPQVDVEKTRQIQKERSDAQKVLAELTDKITVLTKSNSSLHQEVGTLQARNNELNQNLKNEAERHGSLMTRIRQQFEDRMKLKDEEMDRAKESHQQLSGVGLQDLRNRIEEKDEQFKVELDTLRDLMAKKSRELDETVLDKRRLVGIYEEQLDSLRSLNTLLTSKLHECQIQNELEIQNVKQRLTKLHAQQLALREKSKQQMAESLQKDLDDLKKIIAIHEEQMKMLKEKHLQDIEGHKAMQEHLKRGIQQLKQRIHEHNKNADSQHQIMTSLNLNYEQEKKTASSDYSNSVTFLDQQLKKMNVMLEQKNLEINNLLKQLQQFKLDSEQELKDSQERWSRDRDELKDQLDKALRDKKTKEDEVKKKDKELKAKERDMEDQSAKFEAERKAMQRALDEAHHDYKRLADENALLEKVIRQERVKGVGTVGDLNNLRRDKLAELDRQKLELEAIFREQMDQVKNALILQADKLRVERDKLKAELAQLKLQYNELDDNFKKVSSLVASEARLNKDKLVEYQKKMATLNMEINLAQNLYNNFIEAKSRVIKPADKQNL